MLEPLRGPSQKPLPKSFADLIIKVAQGLISETLGMELKELPRSDNQSKCYALKTLLPSIFIDEHIRGDGPLGGGNDAEQGLLATILGLIHVRGLDHTDFRSSMLSQHFATILMRFA